ncbi:hypothetical protein AAVH_25885, partial [Aphelenchoides avenae]
MSSGRLLGLRIHHWAYFFTLILFLREVFDCVLGFSWNLLLLIGAFGTTMILLLGVGALSTHGIGTYRAFFVLYFLLLFATFFSLLVGLIILKVGRKAADYTYETGWVDRSTNVGRFVETEHEFWQFYIYFSFAFFIVELLYMWIMFK